MNNHYTPGSGTSGNGSSFVSRREVRASNPTGSLPVIGTGRSYSGSFDFEGLITSLRELFAVDRQIASQQEPLAQRRDEGARGLYACSNEYPRRDYH